MRFSESWARKSTSSWRDVGVLALVSSLILAFVAFAFALALVSYAPTDPAWSHTAHADTPVLNWLGTSGAFFADFFLYTFGFSAWWIPLLLGVQAYKNLKVPAVRASRSKKRLLVMSLALFLFLLASSAFEAIRMYSQTWALPLSPGGLLGLGLGRVMSEALGFWLSSLLFLVVMAWAFRLWSGVSWLDRAEKVGEWIEDGALKVLGAAKKQDEPLEILKPKTSPDPSSRTSEHHRSPERIEPLLKAPKQEFPHHVEDLQEPHFGEDSSFQAQLASEIKAFPADNFQADEISVVSQSELDLSTAEPASPSSETCEPLLDTESSTEANAEQTIDKTAQDDIAAAAKLLLEHARERLDPDTLAALERTAAGELPEPKQLQTPNVSSNASDNVDQHQQHGMYTAPQEPALDPVLNPSLNPIERGLTDFEFVIPDDHEPKAITPEVVASSQVGSLEQITESSFKPEPTRLEEDDLAPVPALLDAPLELDLPDNLYQAPETERAQDPENFDFSSLDLDFSTDQETQTLQGFVPLPRKKRQHSNDQIANISTANNEQGILSAGNAAKPQKTLMTPRAEVVLPPPSLLDPPSAPMTPRSEKQMQEVFSLIEHTLEEFNIPVRVVNAVQGPVITQFELEPGKGVKGAQIVALTRDLSRALQVSSVRVLENILGKRCLGLEISNDIQPIITLSDVMQHRAYRDAKSLLTLAIGKSADGTPMVLDLQTLPHILMAGAGGSGKSVMLSAMILSLLYRASPEQVGLILIDPNRLELSVYSGVPHLLAPVITDMQLASYALSWCVEEMERRYELMASLGVRHLGAFNDKVRAALAQNCPIESPIAAEVLQPLPQIVVVVDELADLLAVDKRSIERRLSLLAQKAKVAGIHLILATQRATVDVLSSSLKAAIPARLAFHLSSKVESRTILDQTGAEFLLNMADLLYLAPGKAHLERVHGAYVSEEELQRTVSFLRRAGRPRYIDAITEPPKTSETSQPKDPRYQEAMNLVLQKQQVSVSLIQKYLRISYSRAAALVQEMERRGVVSPPDSHNHREVLLDRE